MTKKRKSRQSAQDESQIALSVVEKAIGGKLVDKNPTNLPSALHPKSESGSGERSAPGNVQS